MPSNAVQKSARGKGATPAPPTSVTPSHQLCPKLAATARRELQYVLNTEKPYLMVLEAPLEDLAAAKAAYYEDALLNIADRIN